MVDPEGGLLADAASRGEARFARGADGPFVDEQVGRFATAAAAGHAVEQFKTSATACPAWTQDGSQFSTALISFPTLTSETVATQASGPDIAAYLVVAAQGRWLMTVTVAAATAPSLADTEAIARAAVQRLPAG